jgi:transglutaminase-like putative cysteine protease
MYSISHLVKINAYISSITVYGIIFSLLSPFYSLIFSFLFLLGLYKDFYKHFEIPRFILNTAGILLILTMFLQINTNNIIQPSIDTLTVLLGLKLLEEKKFRDYMQIFFVITLILAGYTLLSISMMFLFYLVFYTFFLNYGIILLSYYQKDPNMTFNLNQLKSLIIKTSTIPLIAIPTTIFLFFLLPRTNYPMLNFLQSQGKGKTGFSDKVALGDVSSIQQDDSIVARVVMNKVSSEIYLRGIVFDFFDGKSWNSVNSIYPTKFTRFQGTKINYTIYLEPTYQQYLLTVDIPYSISQLSGFIIFKSGDIVYKTDKIITSKVRYTGESILTDSYIQTLNPSVYLQLPDLSENIKKLSENFKKNNPEETAKEIFNYLQTFSYSLKDLPKGENPLEEFLFKTKKGNCEYFASAMAVLLRLNSIPSRVVGGYKTTDYNQTGGYYIFREKDAHVWVEAYINGRWIKYDPTPPVRNLIVEQLYKPNKIKAWFELLDYYYTTFIVNYDFSKQVELINKIKSGLTLNMPQIKKDFSISKKDTLIFLFTLFIFYILFLLIKIYKEPYEKRVLNKFLNKMKKYGYIKEQSEGLEDFISKIENQQIKTKALNFVREYEKFIFKDKKMTKTDYFKLLELIKLI